jgi:ankyrin repeat protein
VSLLLQHGADPNKGDGKGWTPLMFAVALIETLATNAQTSAAVVRLLLAAGARKGARNACGHTAEDILSFQQGYCSPDEIDFVANALREE